MDNTFSEILEDFLITNSLTQVAFANKIGVKQSQVSEWLKGKAKPSYDILKSMSIAFEISADFWLGLPADAADAEENGRSRGHDLWQKQRQNLCSGGNRHYL